MNAYDFIRIEWYEIYQFIAAFLTIGVVALAVILAITMFKGEKHYTGGMKLVYDFLSLNGSNFERLVKLLYIIFTSYYILTLPLCFTSGFFTGFYRMVQQIIFEVGGTRLIFEGIMLLYKGYLQLRAIGEKMGAEVKEPVAVAPAVVPAPAPVAAPAPVPAPVAAPAPVPAPVAAPAPVSAPVAAPAPIPEPVAAPAPIPEPVVAPAPIPEPVVAPAPIPEPVTAPAPIPEPVAAPAPIPEPVAAPAPIPEPVAAPATNTCKSCGKQIKEGAKFCPFCGTPQQ